MSGLKHIKIKISEKDEEIIRQAGVREVFKPFDPLERLSERIKIIALEARTE